MAILAQKLTRYLTARYWLDALRARLRRWLLADQVATTTPEPEMVLDCWLDGKLTRVLATGSAGLRLRVQTAKGETLVDHRASANPGAFWRVWRHFNPQANPRWEDGEPYWAP